MAYQTKDGRWYSIWRDDYGKQSKRYFGRGPQGERGAQLFDLEVKAAKIRGEQICSPAEEHLYFAELAQAYLNHCRLNDKSEHFRKGFASLLNNHIIKILSDKPVDKLTYSDDLLKVAEHFKVCSQSTRNRYFGYLRAVFRFGIRHGLTKNNPLEHWKKTKEPPRRSRLTVEDLGKILEHAAPHLAWAIEIEWALGTRPGPSELLSLKWSDIDWDAPHITVLATKTKTDRIIPIGPELLQRLLEMRPKAKTDYLIEYRGKPVNKFRRSFQTAVAKAGIKYECVMYDVRHLFASVMLSGGADLAAVSKLLGHASTHMTANVYYHAMAGEKSRAISLLPSLKPKPEPGRKIVPIR